MRNGTSSAVIVPTCQMAPLNAGPYGRRDLRMTEPQCTAMSFSR